jgi:S-adenosylmethionine-diacylglycerol 3-amino-3-carboxypropyl transferase
MRSETAEHADLSGIGYAQCWEDADILLEALDIRTGHVCLSIASAGDNTLAMLSRGPARVIALDLSAPQIACLELRTAAYRELSHAELLELIGSRPSLRRDELYQRCRNLLSSEARNFWDARSMAIANGIGSAGKFEHYFELFRRRVLPLIHSRRTVERLLRGGTLRQRLEFYDETWNTWRWRVLFRIFFSRFAMAKLGRDPSFLRYVEGNVAGRILERSRYALVELNPAENPYLHWILHGSHGEVLPFALRPENFEPIRAGLDRLEWHRQPIESYFEKHPDVVVDRFNLSDIFEYMSEENYERLLAVLHNAGRSGGRLAYWNMLVPRHRPDSFSHRLLPLAALAKRLFKMDKAFFYSNFVVEEIV